MDIRQITPTYFAAPQIDPADFPAIKEAGIVHVICNRPDAEIPPSHHGDLMRSAAEQAGLGFTYLALTHQTMTPDNIEKQREIAQSAGGPVLAYCASGTRSTIAWALGQAGEMSADDILAAASAGGYELSHLRPMLENIAAQRG